MILENDHIIAIKLIKVLYRILKFYTFDLTKRIKNLHFKSESFGE